MDGADAAFLRLREIRKKTGRVFISVMAGWWRVDSGRERILGENGFWARTDSGRERILGENGFWARTDSGRERIKSQNKNENKRQNGRRKKAVAHFEAGSHEIRKSPSWVHGFLLHLFPN
jgi:hypothetical protein